MRSGRYRSSPAERSVASRVPSGDTAGSFSMLPLAVIKRVSDDAVSVSHRWTPGLGNGIALTMWRLSGSQLKGAAKFGRSGPRRHQARILVAERDDPEFRDGRILRHQTNLRAVGREAEPGLRRTCGRRTILACTGSARFQAATTTTACSRRRSRCPTRACSASVFAVGRHCRAKHVLHHEIRIAADGGNGPQAVAIASRATP